MNSSPVATRLRLLAWSLPMAVAAELCIGLFVLWITSVSVIVVGAGIPLTLLASVGVRWTANRYRTWAGNLLGEPIPEPYLAVPSGAGIFRRLARILTDVATWRDWIFMLVMASIGFALWMLSLGLFAGGLFYLIYPFLWSVTPPQAFGDPFGFFHIGRLADTFVIAPLGLVFWVVWWYSVTPLARLIARISRSLLQPTGQAQLSARVQQLTSSRAETVDTQAAELRRIERDLHDGAQARLVALGMSLGLAEDLLARDPEAARRLVAEARDSTNNALAELRDLVRGIHPPVLADRGLDGAVRALALSIGLPVDITIELPGRLPAPVESAAYFAVAECLTNALKHSGAARITVDIGYTAGLLVLRVMDDGRGGANPSGGSGLRGIERRLAAFDGQLSIASPPGGPTQVRMTVPCELSSPRTSPSSGTA
jgi:signal transduction histidine kinase